MRMLQHGLVPAASAAVRLHLCRDWMRKYKGNASVVLKPRSSEQLSQLLAYCSIKRLAVVPQVCAA
jgi:FAD/FMN-containing dehydrogenase